MYIVQKTLRGVVNWAVRSVIKCLVIERQLVEKMKMRVVLNIKGNRQGI